VEKQGEGEPGRDGLLQQIRRPQDDFRVAIRKTAPCFVPQFSERPIPEAPTEEPSLRISAYDCADDSVVGPLSSDLSQKL